MSKALKVVIGLAVVLVVNACVENKKTAIYQWPIIEGFPKPSVPNDNAMTQDKVALGRMLFYDKNLSFNQKQSCASCHLQANAFAEPIATSIGTTGEHHRRNAPALVNIAYNKTLTWAHDGITSLEHQILLPMFGEEPIELGITGHEDTVLSRFNTQAYQDAFSVAFQEDDIVSYERIVQALSSFVRSLVSLESPFDQYAYYGDDAALSESALRGMDLFFSEKLECHHCHGGFNFTQSTSHEQQIIDRRPFHNTGLYYTPTKNGEVGYPSKDSGLSEISLKPQDNGRFRAPTLRNIAVSAPYMHDGSVATLSEVIDIYASGGRNISQGRFAGDGRENPLKSQFVKGFELSVQDKQDLLAFLHSLTDQRFLTNTQHSDPWQLN